MTETIRYSRIYLPDLSVGTGSGQVVLADGRVVSMDEVNLDAISDQVAPLAGNLLPYKVLNDKWFGLKGYATLADALRAIGTDNRTLLITTSTAIDLSTSIPSNVKLWMVGAGVFVIASGKTLTLSSPGQLSLSGLAQCFSGSGTVSFTLSGTVYPEWWGAKADNSTASATAIQAAITSLPSAGGIVYLQGGTYKVASTLTISTDRIKLQGSGMATTTLSSTVVGLPTIKLNGELIFVEIKDLYLLGNSVQGASGNGHAISMLDPTPDTGAYAPQQCLVDNVRIEGFRGNDSDGRSGTMLACGIAQVSTLENVIRHCYIDTCGHGIYIDTCFTPRLYDSVLINNDKYGAYVVGSTGVVENFFMLGNDILNNGDSSTFAQTGWSSAPTGGAFLYNVQGLHASGNKFKNGDLCNFMLHFCDGVALTGNWIRADNKQGAYVRNCNGIFMNGNHFDMSTESTNSAEYLTIEMADGNNSNGFVIEGNEFRFQGGTTVTHCIKITGDAAARRLQGFKIDNNYFGDANVSSAMTVTNAITVVQATLQGGSISRNSFYAETNATITCCFRTDANTGINDFTFEDNQFQTNGGTITNNKVIAVGTFATRHQGSGSPEGVVTAYIGSTYQRLDGGAGTSFYVKESGTGNTGWSDVA